MRSDESASSRSWRTEVGTVGEDTNTVRWETLATVVDTPLLPTGLM